jgi:hypothetical protein
MKISINLVACCFNIKHKAKKNEKKKIEKNFISNGIMLEQVLTLPADIL